MKRVFYLPSPSERCDTRSNFFGLGPPVHKGKIEGRAKYCLVSIAIPPFGDYLKNQAKNLVLTLFGRIGRCCLLKVFQDIDGFNNIFR